MKLLFLKSNLFLLIILTGVVLSCDGRQTKKENLKGAVSKFKKEHPIQIDEYYPQQPMEIVTDTLLSNNINVQIKNYSLQEKGIVFETNLNTKNNTNTITHHRRFESEIKVFKDDNVIFKTLVNSKSFKYNTKDTFWREATLAHAWVNKNIINSDSVAIDISFINPIQKRYQYYRMIIDEYGNESIELIKEYT